MKSFPYMPWYTQDWFADPNVQALTYEEQGIYLALLGRLWESDDASLPNDDTVLSRILRLPIRKWRSVRSTLLEGPLAVLSVDGDVIRQKRLTREHAQARAAHEIRVAAGRRGGRPRTTNAEAGDKHSETNAFAEPKPDEARPNHTETDSETDSDADLNNTVDRARAYRDLTTVWYRTMGGTPSAATLDRLTDDYWHPEDDDRPPLAFDAIVAGLEQCVDQGVRRPSYLWRVLDAYQRDGLTTASAVRAHEAERQRAPDSRASPTRFDQNLAILRGALKKGETRS